MAAGGGDRDVTFRFLADVGDAVEGVKSVGTEVKELGTEIKAVPAAASELDAAMKRAADAVAKLSDPNISPKRLQTEVLKADIAVEQLAEAMKKAAATGGPTPPDMVARVQQFQTAVQGANARAGELRDRLADLKVKGDQTAQGFEKMAQFGGSAQGMMQGLADTSTGLAGSLAKTGLAVVGVFEALKVGLAIGNQVREAWKEIYGTDMPNLTNWFAKLWTGADNATAAFDRHGNKARSLIGIHNEHMQTIHGLDAALLKLVPDLGKADAAIAAGAAASELWNQRTKEMVKDGQDVTAYGKRYADVIITTLAPALKDGTISYGMMSDAMKTMIQSALAASDVRKKEIEELTAAIAKIKEKSEVEIENAEKAELITRKKLALMQEEVDASNRAIGAVFEKRDAAIKALNQETLSQEEYATKKKAILKSAQADEESAYKAMDEAADKAAEAKKKESEAVEAVDRAVDNEKKAIEEATLASEKQIRAWDEVRQASEKGSTAIDAAGKSADALGDAMAAQTAKMDAFIAKLQAVAVAAHEANTAMADKGLDAMGLPVAP